MAVSRFPGFPADVPIEPSSLSPLRFAACFLAVFLSISLSLAYSARALGRKGDRMVVELSISCCLWLLSIDLWEQFAIVGITAVVGMASSIGCIGRNRS